jgi:hypothetical protein
VYPRLKLAIFVLTAFLFLLQGCSNSGGGSSNDGEQQTIVDDKKEVMEKFSEFTISFSSGRTTNSVDLFEYSVSVKRDGNELFSDYSEYISHEVNNDGSLLITFKEVTNTDDTKDGLSSFLEGDVVTINVNGYTPQQFTIDNSMLEKNGNLVTLKAIESRQTYSLADMVNGSEAVAPRSARGATTYSNKTSVVFQTLDKGTTLTIPKTTYKRLTRSISRLPRSNADTQVHIDMTSIDPRTEYDATIGDFSYDADGEPSSERSTNSSNDEETGLESVVMADLRMTTDGGDEIHCFDGSEYNSETNECSGDTYAVLRMKIPTSQFDQYANKYNNGDKVVPLYSYNQEKATWIRQLDSDGNGLNSELILIDNDTNQKANEGDELYLEGKVGHFSWWNGDYPMEKTCLNVKVDLSNSPNASSYLVVKGVDYTGREFKEYFYDKNTTEVNGISAKESSIVSVELIMSDGSVGDSTTHTTNARSVDGTCEDVEKTLVAPYMNTHHFSVTVKDTQGNLLKDAYVKAGESGMRTDENGSVEFDFAYSDDTNFSTNLYVSYYTDTFRASEEKTVTQNDTEIEVVLDIQEVTFTGKVVENINGAVSNSSDTYVYIYNYDGSYYYQSTVTDTNGTFELKLPKSKVDADNTAYISISKYNVEYARYISIYEEVTLDTTNPTLDTYTLEFSTHTVQGKVIDYNGNPIANANVYASNANVYESTISDENGNYNMVLVGEADKNTTIQAYTYKGKYIYSAVETFNTTNGGTNTQDLTIDLRNIVIKGKVLTDKGIPLENMRVYWSQDYYKYTLTDQNGSFNIETYNEGDGFVKVYDTASRKYLDFNSDPNIRDVELNSVELGKVYDLENLLATENNYAPIINLVYTNPVEPLSDVAFDLQIEAYDPDGDTLTYVVEQRYATDATIDLNGSKATITAPSVGYYYFKVIVSDTNGLSDTKYLSLYIKDHAKPVIDSVDYTFPNSKNYFDKSSELNITVLAHSDEGNSLSYDLKLKNLATNEQLDITPQNQSLIVPTTIENGSYELTVTVSDLYNSSITRRYFIIDDTVAPEIDSFTLNSSAQNIVYIKTNEDVTFDVNLTNDNVSNPTWLWYINEQTFNTQDIDPITFQNPGYYYGYVSVRDDKYRNDSKSFFINVAENAKPVILNSSITPNSITKLSSGFEDGNSNSVDDITISIEAIDPDLDNLTYTFGKLGENEADTNNNSATYSLDGLEVGKYSIKVTVSDGTNNVDEFISLDILKNNPPIITSFIVPLKAKVEKTIKLSSSAYDPNNQQISYEWSTTGGTLTSPNTNTATLTLPQNATDITVTLKVSDGENEVVKTRTISVLANIAPTIEFFTLRTPAITQETTSLEVKAKYGDVDGQIIDAKYIIEDETNTTVLSTTSLGDNIVTTIPASDFGAGNYKIYLEVTDNNGAKTTSQKFDLTVESPNSAPTISSLTSNSVNLLSKEITEINVAATDSDGDNLSFSWSTSGGTITPDTQNPDKATFSAQYPGTYTITAVVSDASGAKVLSTIDITVSDATLNLELNSSSVYVGEDVTATLSMSSGDTIPTDTTWEISAKPTESNTTVSSDGVTATITPDLAGTYTIKATVTIRGVVFEATKTLSASNIPVATVDPDVEGTVTSDNGDTLSGALVRLYNKADSDIYDQTIQTDENGYYSFNDVPSGTYYLVVYAGDGYVSKTQTLEVNK